MDFPRPGEADSLVQVRVKEQLCEQNEAMIECLSSYHAAALEVVSANFTISARLGLHEVSRISKAT